MNGTKPKYDGRDWYVADFNYKDYDEVRKWCTETFGKEDTFPNAWSRWQHRFEHQILFRDSKDYEWFILRWS